MFEKLNFDGARFAAILDALALHMQGGEKTLRELGHKFDPETDMHLLPPALQIAVNLRNPKDVLMAEVVAGAQIGFMLAPTDTIAVLLAAGYMMGQSKTEIDELEKLFEKE